MLTSTQPHSRRRQYEYNLPKVSWITGEFNPNDPKWEDLEETFVPNPIEITHGYSRDQRARRMLRKRPDLRQFILDLICSGDGDVPLFLRVGDVTKQTSNMATKKWGRLIQHR